MVSHLVGLVLMFANCYLFSVVCGEGSGCLLVSVLVSIWTCRSLGMARDPPFSVSQTNTGLIGLHYQAWPFHRFWGSASATHEWVTNIIDWALFLAWDCGLHTCKGVAYESSSYWLSESVRCSLHREAEAEEAASPRKGVHVEAAFALSFVLTITGATLCHPMFHEWGNWS